MRIKHKFALTCIIFTVITLFASIPTINEGTTTNLHLVSRFIVAAIAIYSFYIYDWLDRLPIRLIELIHYVVTVLIIFLIVYLSGIFIEPVTEGGYLDVFITYTLLYIVIEVVFEIKQRLKSNSK